MKKLFAVIMLIVLVGVLMTAAAPAPASEQVLIGVLNWDRVNICGVSDYVETADPDNMRPLPITKVFLTGNFTPTRGLQQGCAITATGFSYEVGTCKYFYVATAKIACPTN